MWASIGLLWHEPLLENYGLQPDLTADRVGLGSRISQHKTNKVGVGHAGWILPHICLEAIHLQSDSPHSLNNDIQVKTLWWTDRPDEGGEACQHSERDTIPPLKPTALHYTALSNLHSATRSTFLKGTPSVHYQRTLSAGFLNLFLTPFLHLRYSHKPSN